VALPVDNPLLLNTALIEEEFEGISTGGFACGNGNIRASLNTNLFTNKTNSKNPFENMERQIELESSSLIMLKAPHPRRNRNQQQNLSLSLRN
jgi:hypothetical protein